MTLMTGVLGPIFQKLRYDEGKNKDRCGVSLAPRGSIPIPQTKTRSGNVLRIQVFPEKDFRLIYPITMLLNRAQ